MWIFSKGRHNKPATLLSELYSRYLFIVVLLIALLGLAQFQSIHEGLYTTGANSLTFAINDALSEPFVTEQIKAGRFVALAPKLLNLLALRGINVRILGANKQVLGERKSKYDPTDLTPFVSDSVMARQSKPIPSSLPYSVSIYTTETSRQVVLFAKVGNRHVMGYIEIGYDQSLYNSVLYQQVLNFLLISVVIILLAVGLIIPVVRAPLLPLHHLINTATRIKQGAFQERLPVMGPRETVRLAEVINDTLDELAKAVEREQSVTVRMKQFVSDASHELRTPLTAVRGFTDVLLRRIEYYYRMYAVFQDNENEDDDSEGEMQGILLPPAQFEDTRQALIAMQRETARLEGLVKDLLQLARLDGGLRPRLETTNIAKIVAELRPQFEILAGRRQLDYDLRVAETISDPSMVNQIVYNLVANAIQYTDPVSGHILITVTPLEHQKARISVKDNGPGISEEQMEKIFDRFYRASVARERAPGGAGLGLSIVSEIVRLHDGKIEAISELGKGTEMRVEL